MSEDQLQQPEPLKAQPTNSTVQQAASPLRTFLSRRTQSLQRTWRRIQPILQTQLIKGLRTL
ncbi:MAG TPA: hypothetical protein V6D03_03015, partial [Candidatus Caenarcaniphilales bacterium]